MSNSSTLRIYTPTPRPELILTKDVFNSPLWQFRADAKGDELDSSGRLGRFARRFGEGLEDLEGMAEGTGESGKLTAYQKEDSKKKKTKRR
jgi:hypothetical protein